MGDEDDGGFVLNIAGAGDDAGDDFRAPKGNPRKRTVLRPERKGRHRGWAGKRSDMVGPAAAKGERGGGRGGRGDRAGVSKAGRGGSGGRGAAPADWAPADADAPADALAAAAAPGASRDFGGRGRGGRGASSGGRGGRDGGRGAHGGRGGRGGRGSSAVEVAAREGDEDDDEGEFRPGDWASLMQKAMIPTEDEAFGRRAQDKPLSALAASRVFGSSATKTTWEGLGLPERLIMRLRDPALGYADPTRAQQLAIPHILNGDDVLIRAETGSGKTLAYVCPLLAALGTLEPRLIREDGTRALVMVPTRELAAQVLRSAEELARAYHWVVCGAVVGGENKQKEKARLRKGVVLLVATPGRLLDHLRNTESFKAEFLKWLVLDEADRLLDLGFEEDLNAILAEIDKRAGNAGRCTALLSATLTKGTSRLMDLAMTDPVTVEVDPEEVDVVRSSEETRSGGTTSANATIRDGDAEKSNGDEEAKEKVIARMPEQLRHTAVSVPAKARLATLAGLLAGWMRGSVPKVMVFLSSCESVEFHYKVLSWLAGEKETTEKDTTRPPSSYAVFRLHGVLSQSDRRAVYAGFAKAKAGVLLCTDVGARGLDFENVGATVQVDPPSDPETYVHRVGRAARLGADGEAVIFLAPRETEYAQVLSELGVKFGAASVPAMLDVLETGLGDDEANGLKNTRISPDAARARRKYESDPHLHPAAMRLQKRLHATVARDAGLSTLARDAFRAHVRAYATFPAKLKHIFHVKRLHLGHVAAAFGLKEAPGLIGKSATRERLQAAKDKKRKDALKAKTDAKEKRKRRAEGKSAPRKAARGTVVGV